MVVVEVAIVIVEVAVVIVVVHQQVEVQDLVEDSPPVSSQSISQ